MPDFGTCWPWRGAQVRGYGVLKVAGRQVYATHLALEFDGRARPRGLYALHSCDLPTCVNPSHLRWGTHAENMREMKLRGRAADTSGEKNGHRKLTAELVQYIRRELREGFLQRDIAFAYGVSESTVSAIRCGYRWQSTKVVSP